MIIILCLNSLRRKTVEKGRRMKGYKMEVKGKRKECKTVEEEKRRREKGQMTAKERAKKDKKRRRKLVMRKTSPAKLRM